VLPARLSYPELLPSELHHRCLYASNDDLLVKLRAALVEPVAPAALRAYVVRFDWAQMAPQYDRLIEETAV
jgi:hypothetical protein